jgi:hypothetical protein
MFISITDVHTRGQSQTVGRSPTISESIDINHDNVNDETNALGKENVSQSIPHQDGRLSTASNTKIVTYEEATRRYAGTVISTPHSDPRPSEALFSPFQNPTDYGVAMYFHRRQLTKGDVDDFLRDKSMQSLVVMPLTRCGPEAVAYRSL